MPVFAYRGFAANGRSVAGVVDADSVRAARTRLRDLGVFPTDLSEESGAPSALMRLPLWQRGRRLPAAELSLFTRQLGALLGAGVQLVDTLETLALQSRRPWLKKALSQVRERVREGSSLADALAAHPGLFSELYVGMVRAGEAAGALETVLERLADYAERQSEFVTRVRSALTYPVIMMCVAAAIMAFLVTYVVPQVTLVFKQSQAALPLATLALIGFSDFLAAHWLALGLAVSLSGAGLAAALATTPGRRRYDALLLRAPYLGPILVRINCARLARTLATLLSSGVQLVTALETSARVVANGLMREAVIQARQNVREGQAMSQTLAASGRFPPLFVEMVRVGERSGELEPMLERLADAYEREVAASLSQLTTVLEPVMTLVMAGVILFMILAVLMPIFQLNQLVR
jgi:general secretion pathway protein F